MRLGRIFRKAAAPVLLAFALMGCGTNRHTSSHKSPPPPDYGIAEMAKAPLPRAYAHNDYKHQQPLFDALKNGFRAVEADIFLVHGQLLVAHKKGDTTPDRTLEELYLKPLAEIAARNGNHVYPQSAETFLLMIDVKSSANETYQALDLLLQRYKHILTSYTGDEAHISAVTVLISGNRPDEALLLRDAVRYAAFDGRPSHFKSNFTSAMMPLISANWNSHFAWCGEGPMPAHELKKLRDMVGKAHARGQRIRFWATPEKDETARAAVWQELTEAGVDYINTDSLPALRGWLERDRPAEYAAKQGAGFIL